MTLNEYLSLTGTNAEAFARQVNVSVAAVNYWRSGARIPRIEQMRKINDVTNGRVAPSDFILAPRAQEALQPVS
jgi:DNA-binding transcriptional regulator YdaS (Cro superfamily)